MSVYLQEERNVHECAMRPARTHPVVLLLAACAASLMAPAAEAACGGTITGMRVIDPPNEESARVEVDYALVGTSGSILIVRRNDSTGEDVDAGSGNVSGTGTFVGFSNLSCLPPDAYTFKATLTPSCNPPVTPVVATVPRAYDNRPTATGTILGFNEDKTSVSVSMDYSFPHVRESSGTGNRRLPRMTDVGLSGHSGSANSYVLVTVADVASRLALPSTAGSSMHRECKNAGGLWPTYKCPGWDGL